MPKKLRLTHILIIEDDTGRREYPLKEAITYAIGRDPDCDLRLFSKFVSRRHATVKPHQHEEGIQSYEIIDGDNGRPSANGLIINGQKLKNKVLEDEDEIVFGPNVSAVYRQIAEQIDEFDITLISPGMIIDD